MMNIISNMFGNYTPVTYSIPTELSDGTIIYSNVVPSGLGGVNWPWVAGVFLFGICLYSMLRIIGGLFRRG